MDNGGDRGLIYKRLLTWRIYQLFTPRSISSFGKRVWSSPQWTTYAVHNGCLFVFSSVKNPRFKMNVDWKATPFAVKNAEIGGSSMMERVRYAFFRGGEHLKSAVDQRTARKLSSFCKDHHFGNEVRTKVSRRALAPPVVLIFPGIYHGDGLYRGEVKKTPLFMIHARRVPSGWCKHKR
jgi:hypothetical protein